MPYGDEFKSPFKEDLETVNAESEDMGLGLSSTDQLRIGNMTVEQFQAEEGDLNADNEKGSSIAARFDGVGGMGPDDMQMEDPEQPRYLPSDEEAQEFLSDYLTRKQQKRRDLSREFQEMHRRMSMQAFGKSPQDDV